MDKRVGAYSFVVGVVIAVVLGLFTTYMRDTVTGILVSVLVLLGLLVGLLNVSGKDTKEFLVVGTLLAVVAYVGGDAANLGKIMYIGAYLAAVLKFVLAFVVPAVIVAALKDVWKLAKSA